MTSEAQTTPGGAGGHDTWSSPRVIRNQAEADHKDVVNLIQELVQVPTRGGMDNCEPLISIVEEWLKDHGLIARRLRQREHGKTVGVICDIVGVHPGPRYVLDACLDTAPFGDENAWRYDPTSGVIDDGWLYGRGAADSKAAIAIFVHIARHVQQRVRDLCGTLTLLFDADEHTGRFEGAKQYFIDAGSRNVSGVMIGYPGIDQLVVGGRGFLRAELTIKGRTGHTGSQRSVGNGNAIDGAAELVRLLSTHHTHGPVDPALDLPPKLTVTGIRGGESFSVVPDRCTVDVDIRLTNSFELQAAQHLIEEVAAQVDRGRPSVETTTIVYHESWPAYLIDDESPMRLALTHAADQQLGGPIPVKAAGPSNIGNYLATLGIPATAGLGVRYEGLHGTNERIDLATIPAIQATYHQAVVTLLSPNS